MSEKDYNKKIIQNLSTISHEIQTPVNLIASTANLINMKINNNITDNSEIKEYMVKIVNNCNKIAMLVSNIMDIDATGVSKKEYVNTKQFFDTFCETVEPYCKEENVSLKCEFKTEKEHIYIPIVTTERILLNLITNAIKYNDKDKKTIEIKMANVDDMIVFTVKDNGMGIAKENIAKVTEQFFRVDKSISNGSGLGLSLVKEYLKLMNGTISIKSKLKKGTEVTVSIPSVPDDKIFTTCESNYIYTPEKSIFNIEFAQFKNV